MNLWNTRIDSKEIFLTRLLVCLALLVAYTAAFASGAQAEEAARHGLSHAGGGSAHNAGNAGGFAVNQRNSMVDKRAHSLTRLLVCPALLMGMGHGIAFASGTQAKGAR